MGAGGSKSSVSTDIYTKNVVEALSKSIQNCKTDVNMTQRVTIIGSFNVVKGVRMVQGFKLNASCAMTDSNVASAQQAVENAIKAQASAQNVALMGAFTKSESNSDLKIHNEVQAKISRETIQNIVNNFNMTQEFYLRGDSNIVEDITMDQTNEVLFNGCLEAVSQISAVQDIKTKAEQISSATQTNPVSEIIGAIGSIFTSLGSMWVIIAVVAMCIGGYLIVNAGGLSAVLGTGSIDSHMSQLRARAQGASAQGVRRM